MINDGFDKGLMMFNSGFILVSDGLNSMMINRAWICLDILYWEMHQLQPFRPSWYFSNCPDLGTSLHLKAIELTEVA